MKTLILLTALSAALLSGSETKNDHHAASVWKKTTITTYGKQYHGRRTASGVVHDETKLSCAVKPIRNKRGKIIGPSIPYGSYLTVCYGDRAVSNIVVLDVCPAGTLDLSGAAMKEVLNREKNINTKVKGSYFIQKETADLKVLRKRKAAKL